MFFGVVILVTVIPVMIAAKILEAENTGFFACTVAVIGSVAAEHISEAVISNPGFAAILAIAITGIFFSLTLGSKYKEAILIALLAYGVQYAVAFLVAGIGITAGVVEVTT